MQNAYFQLVNKEDGTWLKLFPAVDGGETLVFSEVSEYLESHKISCDTTELYKLMDSQSHEQSMRLCMQPVRPERESYSLSLEKDGLEAVVRFYAPTEGAGLLTKDEFMKDLQYRRIVNGIDESVIDAFFADRKYCTDYVVARGCLPEEGKSAVVEYFFNTDPKAKPTVNEDGSVDFFHLNTINHCEAGELLAKLVPAVPGKPGKDVTGKVILPREVKTTKLHYGRRIRYEKAEDGTEAIYSEVNGHVSLVGNDVFVSDVLEVENVDISTGNIDYNGSVQVNGNVCSNFSVRAKGNVDIHGVVEGAAVEAGGNIIIVRGMNGMGKGVLKAGGNVVAKFLESATVETDGNVTCNSIMHSTVFCRGEVTVTGKRGFIAGGKVCAAKRITVKNLGSPMGADTIVEVGTDPKVKIKFVELTKKASEAEKILRSLEPILTNFDDKIKRGIRLSESEAKYLESLLQLRRIKKLQLDSANQDLEPIKEKLKEKKESCVVVSGEAYQGTKICISDVSMVIQNTVRACKFVYLRGDVKMQGLYS